MKLTNEQLAALPERKDTVSRLITEDEAKAMGGKVGDTITERVAPKFIQYKISGDDVIMFHDKDGCWTVDYHLEGGPFKRRFSL